MEPDRGSSPGAPLESLDDDPLMALTARGDTRAFRVLVERWAPRVQAFLARALGNRADAEDATQETFVRAYRAAERYLPSGRFASWLFRIAGNLARQELRRRRVRGWFRGESGAPDDETLLASLPAPAAFDAESSLRDRETRAGLARALARLPERQRLAILLRHVEGLSVRDVASALGMSEHAAESLLARATVALRAALGPLRE